MHQQSPVRFAGFRALAVWLAFAACPLTFAQIVFTQATSTNWLSASNWNPAGAPTSSTDAQIANGKIGVLSANGAVQSLYLGGTYPTTTSGTLTVQNGAVLGARDVFISGSGALTVNGTGSTANVSSQFTIDATNNAPHVTVSGGGTLAANYFSIASVAGSQGQIVVTGAGSTLRDTATGGSWGLMLGNGDYYAPGTSTGTLTITNGGAATNSVVALGYFGRGVALVSGTGSRWNVTGGLHIGYSVGGFGTLTVQQGATVTANQLTFGYGGGAGALVVKDSGSQVSTTDGYVPLSAGSSITIADGGTLKLGTNGDGSLYLAANTTLNLGTGGTTGTLLLGSLDNGGAIVFNHTNNVTFATALTNNFGGDGTITKLGSGNLTLGAANAHRGTTTIAGGTLTLGDALALQNSTATLSGGTLSFGSLSSATLGGLAGTGNLNNPIALTVGANNANTTYSGGLSGAGSLTKSGTGTLTLSGANSQSGNTTITSGTVIFANAGALSSSSNVRLNGGLIGITSSSLANFATGAGGGQVQWTSAGGFAALGGNQSVSLNSGSALTWGSSSLGTNTLILGATTSDGTTTLTNAIDFGAANRTVQVNDGTAQVDAILSGNLSGAGGGLIKSGSGLLRLTGTNNYTGPTSVSAGALLLTSALSSSSNVWLSGGVLAVGAGAPTDYTLGTGGGAVQWPSGNNGGFAAIGGNRTITLNAGAALTWASTASFVGTGQLVLGNSASDATLTLSNAIAFGTSARTVRVDDGSAAIDAALSGNLTGGTGGALTKSGTGTLSLTGTNTYTGATQITGGTLLANSSTALPSGSNIQLNGGVLMLGTGAPTSFTLGTAGGNVRWSGSGGFAAFGADRTVSLNSGAALTWGTTTNFIGSTGTLMLGSSGADSKLTLSNAIAFGSSTRAIQVNDGSAAIDASLSGVLSGSSGGFTKTGAGTLALGGANTYTGSTNINAGVVSVGTLANKNTNSSLGTGAASTAKVTLQTGGALQYTGSTVSSNRVYVVDVGGGTIDVTQSGTTLTLNSGINGPNNGLLTDALIKAGAGTLALGGTGDNSGLDVIVNSGTLQLAKGTSANIVHAVSQNLVINSGGRAQLTGANTDQIQDSAKVVVNAGGTFEFNGHDETIDALSGAGTVVNNSASASSQMTVGGGGGSGTFTGTIADGSSRSLGVTKMGGGTQTFTAANTYSGGTTLLGGTLAISANNQLGAASGAILFGGGTLGIASGSGFTASRATTLQTGGGTFDVVSGATLNWNGSITGSGTLTKAGSGTLVLNGSNDYSGLTFVTGGTLKLGAANALSPNTTVQVSPGAFFDGNGFTQTIMELTGGGNVDVGMAGLAVQPPVNTTSTFNGNLAGSGGFTMSGSGTLVLAPPTNTVNTYTGPTTIESGTVQLGAPGALPPNTPVQLGATATLDLNGNSATIGQLAGSGTVSLGTAPLTIAQTGTSTFSGSLSGSGTVTVSGTGTLVLAGDNSTFTGPIAVSSGSLKLTGSAPNSAVTVSGGTLSGNGTLGDLTLSSGGILSPGSSPGTLNAGNTTWASGASFTWELNKADGTRGIDPGWDYLNITGTLTITATSGAPGIININSLTLANSAGAAVNFDGRNNYTFNFISASSGITGFATDKFSLVTTDFVNAYAGTWAIGMSGNDLNLVYTGSNVTAIPEPSLFAALAGGGVLALTWRRRRMS